jgi:quercetin dioxygenase-like cupin family protein
MYMLKNLDDVTDAAPSLGVDEAQEVRFAREAFGADQVGFTLHRVAPGRRQAIGHKHDHPDAEEMYVVTSGSGRIKVGDEVRAIGRLDAIRVPPEEIRSFEGGPDGLEFLAFGPRFDGDGEVFPGWWHD